MPKNVSAKKVAVKTAVTKKSRAKKRVTVAASSGDWVAIKGTKIASLADFHAARVAAHASSMDAKKDVA
jgi:hypothetical protein